jgi:hypothetical protein
VNGMNDDGHARPSRCKPAEDAGLAAVSVNHIRAPVAEQTGQFPPRPQILPRMDRPHQVQRRSKQAWHIRHGAFERTFGAVGRSGDQIHLESRLPMKAENGRHGIFLRAADDQPGDDVRDAHGLRGSESAVFERLDAVFNKAPFRKAQGRKLEILLEVLLGELAILLLEIYFAETIVNLV